jgi:cystathionine beta-lyase/cystathionine gamma-synthase
MKKKEINSSRMPVYRDAGFELYDAATTAIAFKNETENLREPGQYIYSRYRNPTVVSAEENIMRIEGSEWALLTQSGMSAIDTALSVFHKGSATRPWLFFTEIYGGTISFVESVLKKCRGLDVHYFSPQQGEYDLLELEDVIKRIKPEIVYIESVSNPMLIVSDVDKIAGIASGNGARLVIDNTFATPWLFKPLEAGADIVIHSVTKYFAGHGNLTAGVLCGNDISILKSALEYRKFVGHMISPDDAYRLQTQILSFELRFERQCTNAMKLAAALNSSPVIAKVLFPGLKDHPSHLTALELFKGKGFGAMITFDFKGSGENEKRSRRDLFIKLVADSIKLIPTLGDPHTILLPVEAVWGVKYPEPGMIRLSVGFEPYDELIATIDKALKAIELS